MSSAPYRSRRLRRLSVRLTLWHSLIVLGTGLALLGLTNVLLRNRAYATEKDTIESRMGQYANEYRIQGLAGVVELSALRKGRAQKAFFIRVADEANRTKFLRDPDDWAEFEPEQLSLQEPPAPDERRWQTLQSFSGINLLIASRRLPDGSILQVGKSNEDVRALLSDYLRTGWWMILAFVPASFAGGAFLASRALRPVQDLTAVARSIIETNRFDSRVPTRRSGDELNALVQVFNEMLCRIDTLIRGMRDSIDNVAHDLRTPLMRLSHKAQNFIESNQLRAVSGKCANCEAAIEAVGDFVEEADRVTAMLNTLMDIAETEAGLVRLNVEPVLLDDIVQRAIEAYGEFAEERGICISAGIPPSIRVQADATAISRVFANLLDNAIKYTPAGGSIRIGARTVGNEVRISVADSGVGISPEDLPRIWERLFRGDRSRCEHGLGLGLSFVRAIVEAHGGAATAHSSPSSGTEIIFSLPLAAQERIQPALGSINSPSAASEGDGIKKPGSPG